MGEKAKLSVLEWGYIKARFSVHCYLSLYWKLCLLGSLEKACLPMELQYADDLVLVAETAELLIETLQKWKKGMEMKGLGKNIGKTKVMRCQVSRGQVEDSGQFPCNVCRKRVGRNSILCVECQRWVHKRCRLRNNFDFHCKRCLENAIYFIICVSFTHDNNILPPFPSRITADSTLLDNILFTPASVSTKLQGLTKSATLNPDNFPPIVLQSCARQLDLPLSIIFNTIFELSELPPAWLISTVVPLFKKGERNQASNYRPISITSSCCKVMESIIHDSISSYLLSNNLISDSQRFSKKNVLLFLT